MGVRSPSFVVSGGAVPHACLSSSSSPPHSRKARGWGWRLHLPFCDTSTNYRWCSPRRRQISKRWTMGAAKKARRSCYLLIILRKDARSAISNRISATLLVPSSSAEKDEKFRSCVLRSRFHVWTRVSNGWMDGWMNGCGPLPPSPSLPPLALMEKGCASHSFNIRGRNALLPPIFTRVSRPIPSELISHLTRCGGRPSF